MEPISILIITALKEEFEAARDAALIGPKTYGVTAWQEPDPSDVNSTPFIFGEFVSSHDTRLNIALARPPRMGTPSTAPISAALAERLKPHCLAMCGVCAGNPSDVILGDVIIAEMTYFYDEGKRTARGFEGDHRQLPMLQNWLQAAQDLDVSGLPSYGEASEEEAKIWLLERIYMGEDPLTHVARQRYFPNKSWAPRVKQCETADLVVRTGLRLTLTGAGTDYIEEVKFFGVDTPDKLPFKVKVGPIASGNVVVKDGLTWDHLKQLGVRTVTGLEMEAASVGRSASLLNIPSWVVVKGVMDYADPKKDDRFKPFAARASAEVLFRFIDDIALPWIITYVEERRSISALAAKRLEEFASEIELAADQLSDLARSDVHSLGGLASVASGFPFALSSAPNLSVLTSKVEARLGSALNKIIQTARETIVVSRFGVAPSNRTRWQVGAQVERLPDTGRRPLQSPFAPIDLRIPDWQIRDQGLRATAVAFACSAAAEHAWYNMSSSTKDFSEQFLHSMIINRRRDDREGATLEEAAMVLLKDGVCEERSCLYSLLAEPSSFARRQALHHRFFPNCIRGGEDNAQMIVDVLRRGKVVVVSMPVFRDPLLPDGPTNWTTNVGWAYGRVLNPPPLSVVIGGHAVCVVGFVPDSEENGGGYFIFRNSWGAIWAGQTPSEGNGYSYGPGYGDISASYINKFLWEFLYL